MTARRHPHRAVLAEKAGVILLTVLAGCTSEANAPTAAFEEVFAREDSFILEEPDGYPITNAHRLALVPDGRLVVVDQPSHTIRIHQPDGRLDAVVGGYGEAPGEFRRPITGTILSDGYLYVLESSRQVNRFTPELEWDTVFALEGLRGALRVFPLGDDLLFQTIGFREPNFDIMRRYSRDGRLLSTFHEQHPTYLTAAYWWDEPESIAIGSEYIYLMHDKLPYVYRYTLGGEPVDTFGHPSASWRQASEPRPGEFSGPANFARAQAWLRSFTWVSNIVLYQDSLLVVANTRYDPENLARRDPSYHADVYDVRTTEKVDRDIPLPGRLIAGGEHILLIDSEPPGGWRLGRYTLTRPGR
jgi:hypothetical protein